MSKEKIAERELARKLRKEGKSLRDIAALTKTSVASISKWVRDISLSEEQLFRLAANNPCGPTGIASREKAAASYRKRFRDIRLNHQMIGKEKAKSFDLYLAGCMLYWAEGSKDRKSIGLVNCDDNLLRMFIRFLRECFAVKNEEIRIGITCYTGNGLTVEQIENHWLDVLSLARDNLNKTAIDYDKRPSKIKHSKHPYGMCSIRVHKMPIVQEIFGAIQEFGGFINEKWVD